MDRDDLRRWVESRRAVEEFERRSAPRAGDPSVCWHQALSLFALLDRMVGWPVPPDDVRRREEALAALAWSRLREACRGRA